MQACGVIFKGSTEGLSIIVPEGMAAEEFFAEVEQKVKSASKFFNGAILKVLYRGINLPPEDEAKLMKMLTEQSGATIESLSQADNVKTAEESGSKDSKRYREQEQRQGEPIESEPPAERPEKSVQKLRRFFSDDKDIKEDNGCKFIRTTLRGGVRIQHDGAVVVVGDVNPGAEIVAAGNVIVLGMLRGMVHAGANGSRDAFISALKLKPTQLRIADLIARCPDDADNPGCFPEIASVKDGVIEVNPLYGR